MECRKKSNTRIIFLLMDLPINDKELQKIIISLGFGGDAALYHKLKLVKELREQDLPYKKILREQYGMDI